MGFCFVVVCWFLFISSIGLARRSELDLSGEPWPCVQSPPSLGTKRTVSQAELTGSLEEKPRNPGGMLTWDTPGDRASSAKFQHLAKLTETYPQLGAPAHQHTQPKFTGAMVTPCDCRSPWVTALTRTRDPEEPGRRNRHFKCPLGGARAPPSRPHCALHGKPFLTLAQG